MERVTITIEADLLAEVDALVTTRGYQNRSEALRDLARAGLRQAEPPRPDTPCVAALVYVYDHARRDLPNRLANEFHDHHNLVVSTLPRTTLCSPLSICSKQRTRAAPASCPSGFQRRSSHPSGAGLIFAGPVPDRRVYETAVLAILRDRLRGAGVWVAGSRDHRAFEDYLLPAEPAGTVSSGIAGEADPVR